MQTDVLDLSVQFQVTLVVGYIGYQIATIGRSVELKPYEFILQILVYGYPASVIGFALAGWFVEATPKPDLSSQVLLIQCSISLIFGILFAAIWRAGLRSRYIEIMGLVGVYRDDHETSVFSSLSQAKTLWNCIHVHTKDGRIIEADFTLINATHLPLGGVTLNKDGIAIYATASYDANLKKTEFDTIDPKNGAQIVYIPTMEIERVDIRWVKR